MDFVCKGSQGAWSMCLHGQLSSLRVALWETSGKRLFIAISTYHSCFHSDLMSCTSWTFIQCLVCSHSWRTYSRLKSFWKQLVHSQIEMRFCPHSTGLHGTSWFVWDYFWYFGCPTILLQHFDSFWALTSLSAHSPKTRRMLTSASSWLTMAPRFGLRWLNLEIWWKQVFDDETQRWGFVFQLSASKSMNTLWWPYLTLVGCYHSNGIPEYILSHAMHTINKILSGRLKDMLRILHHFPMATARDSPSRRHS